jgi:hypothetical protein
MVAVAAPPVGGKGETGVVLEGLGRASGKVDVYSISCLNLIL